jgi:hypothetical protein
MTATDLAARADRVKAIAEWVHGKVIDRAGTIMTVEIPADVAPGLAGIWGTGGFNPIFRSQDTHLAPRRIVNMRGHTVVCENDMVTTAYYRYEIDLRSHAQEAPQPSPAAITMPTRPFAG